MPHYRIDINQDLWNGVASKAQRSATTPEALIDVRVRAFLNSCLCEIRDERRNAVISRIVDISADKLDEIEEALNKITRKD